MRLPPSTTQRMQSRGHSPRTIDRCEGPAHITSYAEAFDTLQPVGGGVLDAPRSREYRGGLDAAVRHDRWRPRHPRRVRLRPPPNASNPAGAARAPFYMGVPTLSFIRGRAGVEARPYGVWRRCQRETGVIRQPNAGRRGRRPLRAVCILHVAACDVRAQPAHHLYGRTDAVRHPTPGGRGR